MTSHPPPTTTEDGDLLARLDSALVAVGCHAPAGAREHAGRQLLHRWREPHRAYHDVEHLREVLDALDDLAESDDPGERESHDHSPGAASPEVVLAAWFHDAIYHGHPGEDEEESARLAADVLLGLGVPQPVVRRVMGAVLITKTHETPWPAGAHLEAAQLCDADLAVLAAPADRYRRYVAGVRREFARCDDDEFARGRSELLRGLLGRQRLFATPRGHSLWESRARANIAAELERYPAGA